MTSTSRRNFATGIAGLAILGPLLHLRPASAQEPDLVTLRTPSGRDVTAYLSVPTTVPAPTVILLHGGYGLTEVYRSRATTYAEQGFVALAVDLFDGKTATTLDQALSLVGRANAFPEHPTETLVAWIDWLKADPRTSKKIAAIGWSFGATWALIASSVSALDAAILYYGGTNIYSIDLTGLKAPVLGHFGERDTDPHPNSVKRFAAEMAKEGKAIDVRWYDADHAFDNPMFPTFDKAAAEASRQATLAFLHANLD
jgi:carboxymethylenebutenolidase